MGGGGGCIFESPCQPVPVPGKLVRAMSFEPLNLMRVIYRV